MALTISCVAAPPLMPRDLPLGNGSLQINFDSAFRLVDLYTPMPDRITKPWVTRFGWASGLMANSPG